MPHFSVALEVLWECSWGALVGLWPAVTATRGPFVRGRQQLYHAGECTKSGAKVAAVSAAMDANLLTSRGPLFVLRELLTSFRPPSAEPYADILGAEHHPLVAGRLSAVENKLRAHRHGS